MSHAFCFTYSSYKITPNPQKSEIFGQFTQLKIIVPISLKAKIGELQLERSIYLVSSLFFLLVHTYRTGGLKHPVYFICYKSSVGLFETQTRGDNDNNREQLTSKQTSSWPKNASMHLYRSERELNSLRRKKQQWGSPSHYA